jgi:hypothetical protein
MRVRRFGDFLPIPPLDQRQPWPPLLCCLSSVPIALQSTAKRGLRDVSGASQNLDVGYHHYDLWQICRTHLPYPTHHLWLLLDCSHKARHSFEENKKYCRGNRANLGFESGLWKRQKRGKREALEHFPKARSMEQGLRGNRTRGESLHVPQPVKHAHRIARFKRSCIAETTW